MSTVLEKGVLDSVVDVSPSDSHFVVAQKEILLDRVSPLHQYEVKVRPAEAGSYFFEEKRPPSLLTRTVFFWRRVETTKRLKVDMQIHLKDGRGAEIHPLDSSSPSPPLEWRRRNLNLAVAVKSRSSRRVRLKLEYEIVSVRAYEHVTTKGIAAAASEAAIGVQNGGGVVAVRRC